MADTPERTLDDLVFVGFKDRVVALDRVNGEIVWDWKAPQGAQFATLLLDGDRLIVGVDAYFYCLDPVFGQVVWEQPLKGYGTGVVSIASARGSKRGPSAASAAQQAAAATNAATM